MKTAIVAALLGCAASGVMAQDMVGGSVSVGYMTLFEDDIDNHAVSLGGSAEFAASRTVSLQVDGAYTTMSVEDIDLDATGIGAHAIYHANENASFGAYLAHESIEEANVFSYGVEAGYGAGPLALEGYMGVSSVEDFVFNTDEHVDFNTLGVAARYAVTPDAALGVSYDRVSFSSAASGNALALTGRYGLGSGLRAEAELGRVTGEVLGTDLDNSTYASMTVSYGFGKRGEAAFERRGLVQSFGGF
ncbi:MAG: hypothetical protein CSA72_05290 [Rhodobacterales bacterium]|nr:MAG: hypothetical protein CSA72_05290 [Rhodobacterales bacterium]